MPLRAIIPLTNQSNCQHTPTNKVGCAKDGETPSPSPGRLPGILKVLCLAAPPLSRLEVGVGGNSRKSAQPMCKHAPCGVATIKALRFITHSGHAGPKTTSTHRQNKDGCASNGTTTRQVAPPPLSPDLCRGRRGPSTISIMPAERSLPLLTPGRRRSRKTVMTLGCMPLLRISCKEPSARCHRWPSL